MSVLKECRASQSFNVDAFYYIPSLDSIVRVDSIDIDGNIKLTYIETDVVAASMTLSRLQFEELTISNLLDFEPIFKLD
jgi:hypothetical protein